MSGHSKWSQIKHKKGASDQKKGVLFSKLAKIISIAAQDGVDTKNNLKLKTAVDKARSFNMPSDSIERAIKRASEKGQEKLKEFQVEIIGPDNVSIIVNGISDNTNRTIGDLKLLCSRNEGKVVPEGSLSWAFDKTTKEPQFQVDVSDEKVGQLENLVTALEEHDDVQNVYTNAK